MSGQIFISYRRQESSAWAGRVSDRLRSYFPSHHIFIDVDSVDPGEDFVKKIEKTVGSCDVLIAIIGRGWLSSCDQEGQLRLVNPEDVVRMEIASALKRDIRVIPVLVDGASMPLARDLPYDLKALVRRNALQLSHDRFQSDSERLGSAVARALEKSTTERLEREEKEQLDSDREIESKKRLQAERRQREERERLEHPARSSPLGPVEPVLSSTPKCVALTGHTKSVSSVAFSPDGALLASGSFDTTVRLWRVSDGATVRTLLGHSDLVRSVAFSPDGALLASGSRDKTLRLWRVVDGAPVRTLKGRTEWFNGIDNVTFSPDGALLASGG
jgi:WD40 repeat protein